MAHGSEKIFGVRLTDGDRVLLKLTLGDEALYSSGAYPPKIVAGAAEVVPAGAHNPIEVCFMTPDDWQRVKEAFQSALILGPEERNNFLHEFRNAEPDLFEELESLLRHHDNTQSLLETHDLSASQLATMTIKTCGSIGT